MPPLHPPSCDSQDNTNFSALNPLDGRSPAKRMKRLFYDPEHMPTLELVFSEYDSKKGTFAPSLQDAPPSASFHPHSSSSQNEMSSVVEDPSYFLRRASSVTSRSALNETELSNQLRSSAHVEAGTELCRSSFYPCSPISRKDTLGSPLQECTTAYADADRGFQPVLSSSVNPMLQETQQRNKQILSDRATPKSFESASTRSSIVPSIFSGTSRATTRGRSSTWSSDVTTVAPSSLPSVPEHKSVLFDRNNSGRKPGGFLHTRAHSTSTAESEGLVAARYYAAHYSRNLSDKDWETETITDALHPDDECPRLTSSPEPYLGALYEECGTNDSVPRTPSHVGSLSRRRTPQRSYSMRRAVMSMPEPCTDESISDDEGAPSTAGAKDGRLTTMAAALRHRYVGLSYKVRLALFRTEQTMAKTLNRRYRRSRTTDSDNGTNVSYM